MLKLWKNKQAVSHEELFLTHYSKLLTWAMQLTGQDRSKAEDLVHDVFIQFVVVEPELSEVENLEGYLFATMRNLLRSQMRRQSALINNQMSLLDYDSAELGLRARDLRHDVRVREELELICHYASVRKETSRAGSALLLRFYLGYYPAEIARILKSSRQAVADLLGAARREAKLYLTHPNRLSFMKMSPLSEHVKTEGVTEDDFLLELRRAIFRSCQGVCPPRRRFKEAYREGSTATIELQESSHFVSCPRCLDIVNQELGLALLSERHPTDTIGPDQGGGGATGGSSGGGATGSNAAKDAVKRFRRRLKDVFEHEPRELHIAINGRILGSQSITSDLNRQNLLVDSTEKLEFVEVFSEQGVRLFSMSIDPPPQGPFEKQAQVSLSESRTLSVAVSFNGPTPALEIVYRDPGFKVAFDAATATPRAEMTSTTDSRDETVSTSPDIKSSLVSKPESSFLGSLLPTRSFLSFIWSRRALVGALASVIAIAAFLLFRSSPPVVTAAELLRRSAEADTRSSSDPNVVVHRAFNLSVRAASDGRTISRQRIETWQSTARGLKVRRLFDDRDKLIAGEWRKSDGSAVVYRSGSNIENIASSQGASISPDSAWLSEPGASDFLKVAGSADQPAVREETGRYIISFKATPSQSFSRTESGSITLNRADLHAVEQTLVIGTAQGPLEFHFTETQFERRALHEITPQVFEPDAAFFRTPTPVAPAVVAASLVPSPVPSPIVATAELEVEILSLLDQVGATLGEEVSVSRAADGALQIAGVVEGPDRKQEILAALAPLAAHPATRVLIETSEEAQLRLEKSRAPSESIAVQIQESAPASGTIAVDRELRAHIASTGVAGEKLDEEINEYANRALRHSRQAMLYAWSLRKLVQRFSTTEVQSLERSSRMKWLSMIIQHTQGFEREMTGLRAQLTLAFPAKAAADETVTDATDEVGLTRLILRMTELSTITDEAIRSAFTLSGGDGLAIGSATFWRTLSNAELLAQKIEQGAQTKATQVRNSR